MKASDVATVVLSMAAVIGLIVALLRWFFSRGADEREMTIALKDNTDAIREMSLLFNDFRTTVTDRFHVHDIRLAEHDGRLNRLEAPLSNGRRSSDRNAGPPE